MDAYPAGFSAGILECAGIESVGLKTPASGIKTGGQNTSLFFVDILLETTLFFRSADTPSIHPGAVCRIVYMV